MKEIYIRRPNNEIDLTINYKSHDLRNNTFNNRFYRGILTFETILIIKEEIWKK